MKIKLNHLIFVLLAILLVACSEDESNEIPEEKGYVAPEPPGQILQQNVFQLRLLSNFNNNTLFSSNNYSEVVTEIASENKAYAIFLDRADAGLSDNTVKNPTVEIAKQTNRLPYFMAENYTAAGVNGTGIILKAMINKFSGKYYADDLLIAGPQVRIMASNSFTLNLSFCRILNQNHINSFVDAASELINNNQLVIGVVPGALAEELDNTLKLNARNFRFQSLSETVKGSYVPFVFGPLNFAYRNSNAKTLGDDIKCLTLDVEALL